MSIMCGCHRCQNAKRERDMCSQGRLWNQQINHEEASRGGPLLGFRARRRLARGRVNRPDFRNRGSL